MTKKSITSFAASFAIVFLFSAVGFSQTAPSKDFPNIKIKNFGQMDERFYRGARPQGEDFAALKALGINTIIDLTDDKQYDSSLVEAAGLRYVSLMIPDKSYPTEEIIANFLKIIDDKDTGVFYVHCAGGRHRTGNMGALYRFAKYGWNYDQVYKEMKNYDFYSSWGHGKQKDFVIDYAAKMQAKKTLENVAQTTAP